MLKTICKLFIVCCLITVAGCDRDIVEPNKAKNPTMGPEEINAFLDRLFMEKIQQSPNLWPILACVIATMNGMIFLIRLKINVLK